MIEYNTNNKKEVIDCPFLFTNVATGNPYGRKRVAKAPADMCYTALQHNAPLPMEVMTEMS